MTWPSVFASGVVVLGLLGSVGCSDKKAEIGGFGPWRFSQTTLAKVKSGRCQPMTLKDGRPATWCFGTQPYKIGSRTAEVDLYFEGTDPAARLIEIQLKIRGCLEAEVDRWMRANLGAPSETRGTVAYFQNSFLWAAAFMPEQPGRCLVHMLPLSEAAEIGRIKAK